MHRRNPYKEALDFRSLAEAYPPLKQLTLTQALLKRDFGISLTLPDSRLCPPVPNRLNYILWIQDILYPYIKTMPKDPIRGLDIGTGASTIYPLLACSLPAAENWTFIGTEIDTMSVGFARRNVEDNGLQARITIERVFDHSDNDTPILGPLLLDLTSHFDFTMCNPPFYSSHDEIAESHNAKGVPPRAVCTGAENEIITPGGEKAFVFQMIQESMRLDVRNRCWWFTSMLGKLSSVGSLVEELRRIGVDNYALTQFIQGTTRRWAIAWSFGVHRLPDTFARVSGSSLSSYNPMPNTLGQPFSSDNTRLKYVFKQALSSIEDLVFEQLDEASEEELWAFHITAWENLWSRAARRKRKRENAIVNEKSDTQAQRAVRIEGKSSVRETPSSTSASTIFYDNIPGSPELICKIYQRRSENSHTVEIQWIRGKDRELFEGFWNHVNRKVKEQEKGWTTGTMEIQSGN